MFYVLAQLSLNSAAEIEGVVMIWPSSGILLAALMLSPRREWLAILLLCGTASLIANLNAGAGLLLASGLAVTSMAEGVLAVRLFGRDARTYGALAEPYLVFRYTVSVVAAGIASGLAATFFVGGWSAAFFVSWATTVIFGMWIITPLIITISQYANSGRQRVSAIGMAKCMLIFGLVAAVTALVFTQSTYPLLFLPLALMLLATYLFGPPGAAASIFIILTIGLLATTSGQGPIAGMNGSHWAKVLLFQFYLAVGLLSSFPLAALLAQRDKILADLKNSNRLLELAEEAAHVGHWRLDLQAGTLVWSAEVYRIHGYDPSAEWRLDRAIEAYHPDDRQLIEHSLKNSIETGEPFEFEARVVRPNGQIRFVASNGQIEKHHATGKSIAVFGMVMDITDRVNALNQLETARKEAKLEAEQVAILAETDQLTGIANRRKILGNLRNEIARAEAFGTGLTIAVLDVDHFKSINDRFGHVAGDDVLIAIANAAADGLRAGDSFGRVGGEEFVAILPATSAIAGVPIAERIRDIIADLDWEELGVAELSPGQVTVSIGLASHKAGQDERALIMAADRALYQAKADGRNMLRVAA